MKIKETLTNLHVVRYYDFESFVKEHYGHAIKIVAAEEWSNDTQHLYKNITVDDKQKWTRWDLEDWAKFINGGMASYGITRSILEDLVAEGVIEPGNYIITVSW